MSSVTTALSLQSEAAQLLQSGRQKEARARCGQALSMFSESEPASSPRAAYCLCSMGAIFEKTGAYAEAETCAARALAMLEDLPGAGPSAVLLRLRGLGLLGTA